MCRALTSSDFSGGNGRCKACLASTRSKRVAARYCYHTRRDCLAQCSHLDWIRTGGTAVCSAFRFQVAQDLIVFRRRLRRDLSTLGSHPTQSQQANSQERKNTLQRKIDSWCAIQRLYVPSLAMLRRQSQTPEEDDPQHTSLWLPSAICGRIQCHPRLYAFEWDLRLAQANDALHDLRQYLQLRSHLYKYKDRFVTGQRANTRSNTMISQVQASINASVSRYRTARNALLSLAQFVKKGEAWKATIMDLLDADVHGMTVGEEGESEGHRSMSWIWKQSGIAATDDSHMHECTNISTLPVHLLTHFLKALRVEWCKSRARAMRWTEETLLLLEEMRRTLQFLDWQAKFWVERAGLLEGEKTAVEDSTIDLVGSRTLVPERNEGVRAYALRQARIRNHLHDHFKSLWRAVPGLVVSTAGRDSKVVVDLGTSMVKELTESASFLLR
jgi:hypothetical protein